MKSLMTIFHKYLLNPYPEDGIMMGAVGQYKIEKTYLFLGLKKFTTVRDDVYFP